MRIQLAIPATTKFARRSLAHALGDTLRTWRARARERAELATMDPRERGDLPFARDFDIRSEITKPFWRD